MPKASLPCRTRPALASASMRPRSRNGSIPNSGCCNCAAAMKPRRADLVVGLLAGRAVLHARIIGIRHADGELVAGFNHPAAAVESYVSEFFGGVDRRAILVFH